MTVTMVLMGGLIGIFILTYIVDGMVEKASGPLPIDTRNLIYQAEAATLMWWRLPDIFGIALMLLGILKSRGMLGAGLKWGIPAMAVGLLIVCGANIFRAWLRKRHFAQFASGSPAARTAATAAITITVAELALAGATLFYTGDRLLAMVSTPAANTAPTPAPGQTQPLTARGNPLWIDEKEALLRLKGRGAAYLQALVEKAHVRSETQNGERMYRGDDFDAMLEFPSYEELGLKKP